MPPFCGGYALWHVFGKIHTMKMCKKVWSPPGTACGAAVLLAACFMTGAACAASEASSASAFVYVDTAESPFWRTATNNVVEISVDSPANAGTASLSVTGSFGYSMSTNGLASGLFALALPAATSPETEDVYDLVLTLGDGTVRTARFGVVAGVSNRPEGSARCIPSGESSAWAKFHERAVMPIPYGAVSLSIGGDPVDTGLDGAAGWYPLGPVAVNSSESVSLETPDAVYARLLNSAGIGFLLLYR